jgi:AcrR family transcriptional regulator
MPNARGRLEQAALQLYSEHGFDQTTVAEIAERAGLTQRTFFRHFADKREVLFSGVRELQDLIVRAVAGAPKSAAPIDAVAAGLTAAGVMLQGRQEFARQRARIVAANAELREREFSKLASLSAAVAGALRGRDVEGLRATLMGEIAVAVFRIAFERWIDETNQRDLPDLISEAMADLEVLFAGNGQSRTAGTRPRDGETD